MRKMSIANQFLCTRSFFQMHGIRTNNLKVETFVTNKLLLFTEVSLCVHEPFPFSFNPNPAPKRQAQPTKQRQANSKQKH